MKKLFTMIINHSQKSLNAMATKANKSMVGKTVKYLGNQDGMMSSGYNAPIGAELRITSVRSNAGRQEFNVSGPCGNGYVYAHEVQLPVMTADEIKADIKAKEEELTELKGKLKFIEKFGLTEYDEDEFKAYLVLETLGIDDIQKAKTIVKILAK